MVPGTGRKRRAAAGEVEGEGTPALQGRATQRGSQATRNLYFDERDKELEAFEEGVRRYQSEATSAVTNNKVQLSTTEEEKLVRDVMRFMIFCQERKPGVPVSRGELAKLFPANRKASSTMVIKLAQAKFPDALGLEMREIKVASAKAPAGSDEGSKYYILRSLLPDLVRTEIIGRDVMQPATERAFELMVLALIVMNGERISEEDLWRLLEDVGVTKSTHPTLMKKPEELIKHMITKRYLKMQRGRGEAGATYEWGANAEDEIGRPKVDEYIRKTIED